MSWDEKKQGGMVKDLNFLGSQTVQWIQLGHPYWSLGKVCKAKRGEKRFHSSGQMELENKKDLVSAGLSKKGITFIFQPEELKDNLIRDVQGLQQWKWFCVRSDYIALTQECLAWKAGSSQVHRRSEVKPVSDQDIGQKVRVTCNWETE